MAKREGRFEMSDIPCSIIAGVLIVIDVSKVL